MKTIIYASLFASSAAIAAPLELPALSQAAKVSHTVGLTEVTIDYSSPAVKGRGIWGTLVPHGQVWRAGANRSTKITFSKDATFGTTAVPAGTYAIFVIPNKTGAWQFIINKDKDATTDAYKKEQDVVRVDVKPEAIAARERLSYQIVNATNDAATIALEWEKVRLSVPFKVNTDTQVAAGVTALEDEQWVPFNRAARYFLEQKKDYDAGLKLVETSIKHKEEWFNLWTKAQLLAAKGNYKEAYPLAQKANELGEKKGKDAFFYSDDVKAALKDWKAKS